MKRFVYTLILLTGIFCSGCGDCGSGVIRDFATYDVRFFVTNAAGENLMDPEVEGNWLDRDIYIEYGNEIYRMNMDDSDTRANMPRWLGLRTGSDYWGEEPIMLRFGEFGPTAHYQGTTFTIHWGDGTSDEVTFDLYITWKKCDPTVHKTLWFNDAKIPDESFNVEIVK